MAFRLVVCISINYELPSRRFDREENAFIVDYERVNENGHLCVRHTGPGMTKKGQPRRIDL